MSAGQAGDSPGGSRNPVLLWIAQYISATGDSLFIPCVGWLAGGLTGEGGAIGIAVFAATVPHLLFGPVAGALADRFDRRGLMIVCDAVRALLLIAFPLVAFAVGGVSYVSLVVLAFVLAAFTAPFLAARDALLPELVPVGRLPRWNAWIQTSAHIALIQGLGLAGLLLAWMTAIGLGANDTERVFWLVGLDGLTFVLSAIALLLMTRTRVRRPKRTSSLLADARAGLSYARKDRVVRGVLVLTALNNLAIMGPAFVGAVLLIQRVFGLEMKELAWFEGTMAVGMLVGALVLTRFGRRWNMAVVLFVGMVVDGLTYIPFLWLPTYSSALAMIALHGLFIPFIVVGRTSLIQLHVPDEKRGKVFALVNVTVMGMTSVSALACGWIAEAAGTRILFGIAGVFGALTGIIGAIWIGRRLASVTPTS